MRVITLNVNGIRSAHRKGFFDWMLNQEADLICLQEIKAKPDELYPAITSPAGYLGYFHSADTSGYAGVALYTRKRPDQVISGLGWPDFDREGRFLRADFGSLSVVSIYLPSGSSSEERQRAKFAFHAPLIYRLFLGTPLCHNIIKRYFRCRLLSFFIAAVFIGIHERPVNGG